jgi:hypothetical protein
MTLFNRDDQGKSTPKDFTQAPNPKHKYSRDDLLAMDKYLNDLADAETSPRKKIIHWFEIHAPYCHALQTKNQEALTTIGADLLPKIPELTQAATEFKKAIDIVDAHRQVALANTKDPEKKQLLHYNPSSNFFALQAPLHTMILVFQCDLKHFYKTTQKVEALASIAPKTNEPSPCAQP